MVWSPWGTMKKHVTKGLKSVAGEMRDTLGVVDKDNKWS